MLPRRRSTPAPTRQGGERKKSTARKVPESQPPKEPVRPTQEEITRRAYEIFIERGRPEGRHVEHWLEAERQLLAARRTEKLLPSRAASGVRRRTSSPRQGGRRM
jgi:Protein of unknown function (DUF2934)